MKSSGTPLVPPWNSKYDERIGGRRVKRILIATSSFDEHAYSPVRRILERRGFEVILYRTDRLISGLDKFSIVLRSGLVAQAVYEGVSIDGNDIQAAWYRKVGSFSLPDADDNLSKQLYMNNEVRVFHETLWPTLYPDDVWLSPPRNISNADQKLWQLRVAAEVGFVVPETVLGSDWDSISENLLAQDDCFIVKLMRGVISDGNKIKAVYTTVLRHVDIEKLKENVTAFPGMYQTYIRKDREWRVTVVGDEVFAAAVYTDDSAKDDWRKHQNLNSVTFKREVLPDVIHDQCRAYLARMGLRFGAFDLVESPDGAITFLECNPNGQYGWLEETLEFPISEKIADLLAGIAERPWRQRVNVV